jgi:hypothetical protein
MALTRSMTIIAQDPSIKDRDGRILRSRIAIPYERLGPGPRGYRVHVVDYDSSQRVLYQAFDPGDDGDAFAAAPDRDLLTDPWFHAQNTYAIVMRLLARFERGLGRRVSWGFNGHQIHICPHAFLEANAYYSDDNRGIYFGYFPGADGKTVFTCLSHDVIAHETTHALLDGLRGSYTLSSGPDQAGFHEGFADIVALLSVFGLKDVVSALLPGRTREGKRVRKAKLTVGNLCDSVLLGLAEQFGREASRYRADCLRRAVRRPPRKGVYESASYDEAHKRGEILSAAVLNAFIAVWARRLRSWLPAREKYVAMDRVVEDGADAAEQLLTMCIRALDYCPVVDIKFGEFLSALLTADMELVPDDGKYKYRPILREQFSRWGIVPEFGSHENLEQGKVSELGVWRSTAVEEPLDYDGIHREPLERDREEVFKFLWANRRALKVFEHAYTEVISVRPSMRQAPDGFLLRETVSEYRQRLDIAAHQLPAVCRGMRKPDGMPDNAKVCLRGGGVLIFDEYGKLKYHIRSRIDNADRQNARLEYLTRYGIRDRRGGYGLGDGSPRGMRFAVMHSLRDGLKEQVSDLYDEAVEGEDRAGEEI